MASLARKHNRLPVNSRVIICATGRRGLILRTIDGWDNFVIVRTVGGAERAYRYDEIVAA